MKKVVMLVIANFLCGYAISAESYTDTGGTNVTGAEKVCLLSNASNEAFKESVKKCRRGDIMALGGVSNLGAMELCDFTKTIMHDKGSPIACVFIGNERPAVK